MLFSVGSAGDVGDEVGTSFPGRGLQLQHRQLHASADPEDQTQDHNGKKAEEDHQPAHNDDYFDRPPLAHRAPTNGITPPLRRIAE